MSCDATCAPLPALKKTPVPSRCPVGGFVRVEIGSRGHREPQLRRTCRRTPGEARRAAGCLSGSAFFAHCPLRRRTSLPPACISTCAMNTGKLHRREIEGRGAAVRGSKVKNIAIRSPLDALHDPPSHAGPRFACCARAARICGGALVQVIVWPVPTGTGRARSPKKRTPARRAESAHQYAFNSAQQSARHRVLNQNMTSPPPQDPQFYTW